MSQSIKENFDFVEKTDAYPVLLKNGIEQKFLLWIDGKSGRDYFLRSANGNVYISNSLSEIRDYVVDISDLNVHWDESSDMSLNQLWGKIKNLRAGRASSIKTCSIIINGWNFLEDLAHTLGILKNLEIKKSKKISKIYNKFLCGNNLRPIKPMGRQYNPIWTKDELALLRPAIRQLWKKIVKISPGLV